MARLRCTQKLLKLLGKEAFRVAREDTSDESELDWYANLFYVEGRKCLIFTNVGTLASFVALDILKGDVADLPSFFRGRYREFLGSLEATAEQIEHELASYQDFEIGKSTNRKVLGAMSSLTNDLYYSVGMAGGIWHANETDVSAWLVWTLIGKPMVKPIEELEKRIPGIRTSFDPLAGARMLPTNALTEFIQRTDSLIGELGYYGLRGFLFAVLTAPKMIMPSEWTEMLLEGDESHFAGPEHAMKVIGLIHEEYNEINEAILDGVGVRPDHCPLRADAMANFDPTAPAHNWSRGFAVGFSWLLEEWAGVVGKRGLGHLHEIASDLLFFSSREAAIEVLELAGRPADRLIDHAEDARDDFYQSARSVAKIGRAAQRPMGDGGLIGLA